MHEGEMEPTFARVDMAALPKLPANARMIHAEWRNGDTGVSSGVAVLSEMSVPEYCMRYKCKKGDRGWPAGMSALDIALALDVNFGHRLAREFCKDKFGASYVNAPVSLI